MFLNHRSPSDLSLHFFPSKAKENITGLGTFHLTNVGQFAGVDGRRCSKMNRFASVDASTPKALLVEIAGQNLWRFLDFSEAKLISHFGHFDLPCFKRQLHLENT